MREIFISKNGSDNGLGTIDNPFRTLDMARDEASKFINKEDEINIYLREGIYEVENTFEILTKHSGNEKCNITYCAYNNEKVIISGGKTLNPSKFRKVTDNEVLERLPESARPFVLCYDLKTDGLFDYGMKKESGFAMDIIPSAMELFIDNSAMELAGWPNNKRRVKIGDIVEKQCIKDVDIGMGLIDPNDSTKYINPDLSNYYGATIKYDYDRADRWGKAKDAFAFGYFGSGFGDKNMAIEYVDTENKLIKFKYPEIYSVKNDAYYNTYRVYNLLEEIDVPGEYYIDKDNGILYLYPPTDFSENSKINVSIMGEPLFAIEDAKHVNIKGVIFENTRGMAIYSHGCEQVRIQDCVFRNLGTVAVSFGLGFEYTPRIIHSGTLIPAKRKIGGLKAHIWDNPYFNRQGGYNNTIIGCEVYNTGSGGIILDGGDRYNLIPGNCKVIDCYIHDFNRIDQTYRPGVRIFGVANSVSFCKIYNCPQQAIELHGNDHIIEYNEIFNACTDNYDNGAIYIGHKHFSRNSAGCVIKHNYFHDNGSNNHYMFGRIRTETYDVYFDGHPATLLFGNVFACSNTSEGTFINMDSHYVVAKNNIYINQSCFYHLSMYDNDFSYDPFEAFDNEVAKKWDEKYPILRTYLKAKEIPLAANEIINNVHVGAGHFLRGAETVYKFYGNTYFEADPGFIDMENSNYKLKPDSTIFSKIPDFINIPFEFIANYSNYLKVNNLDKK